MSKSQQDTVPDPTASLRLKIANRDLLVAHSELLRDELHSTKTANEALGRENQTLRDRNESLEVRVAVLWSQIEDYRRKATECTIELKLAEAKTRLAEVLARHEAVEDEIASKTAELESAKSDIVALRKEVEKLGKQNAAMLEKSESKIRHITPVKDGGKDRKPPLCGIEKSNIKPFSGILGLGQKPPERVKSRTGGSWDSSSGSLALCGRAASVKCE